MLLSLIFVVKVIQQREVIEKFAESAPKRKYFCYHKTGGLCTSEIKKILCVNKV